jgi:opacity protein-like surface antigen
MTQALNLANFANKLNSSGQADNTALQSGVTYPVSISGNAATATSATSATSATNATNATNLVSGGTIASNVTATTQSAGDNSTKIATTAFVESSAFGIGQTWTNVTSSRTSGTTYTNTNNKAIAVTVQFNQNSGGNFVVQGVTIATFSGTNLTNNYSFIVPAGASYSVTASISNWCEMA